MKKINYLLFIVFLFTLTACRTTTKENISSERSSVEISVVGGPAISYSSSISKNVENSLSTQGFKEIEKSEEKKFQENTISTIEKNESEFSNIEKSKKSEEKNKKLEEKTLEDDNNIEYGLPDEWNSMDDAIFCILNNMEENGYKYDKDDNEFFWTSIFYLVSMDGYNSPAMDEFGGGLKFEEHYVRQFAASMFGEWNGNSDNLPDIPDTVSCVCKIDNDNYGFYVGDFDETVDTEITECIHKNNLYTIKVNYLQNNIIKNKYEITLIDSTFDDGKPTYHWSIISVVKEK